MWTKERALDQSLAQSKLQLAAAKDQIVQETQRSSTLERDIIALKESIEATQKAAAAEAARLSAEKTSQTNHLEVDIIAAREQIKNWQAAITERDTKLANLNQDLAATRQRLQEAIKKLTAAGAR